MNSENINEKITLNITMNVVLITAISLLINRDYFTDVSIVHKISDIYGISLVALVLFYVFFEFWGHYFNGNEITNFRNLLLGNLVIASLLLFILIKPNILIDIISAETIDSIISVLMLLNGAIPFILVAAIIPDKQRRRKVVRNR
ncbi:hypothetical protein [Methanolobus halotolerans]|uniref:Uncharacterized protein n=1 Tax=Methanolobus halotolerans TaxID=2052935 RepID=A0A4E0PXH4_9EURY|nr:hypothetical protein [Methanolobus halotolerans]TGC09452.1 hypothetical protein CUN85_06380 [Methanolobus halotolerans]